MTRHDTTCSRRRMLARGGAAAALVLGGTAFASPALARGRGPAGGGGVGFITNVGLDKLDGGDTPFEFTGREDLPNWRVPRNCQRTDPDDQVRANNVQIADTDDGTTLGLLLPEDRDVPEPGSGPYEIHNIVRGCGTSPDDGRDRELIRVNFKPATPRGPP